MRLRSLASLRIRRARPAWSSWKLEKPSSFESWPATRSHLKITNLLEKKWILSRNVCDIFNDILIYINIDSNINIFNTISIDIDINIIWGIIWDMSWASSGACLRHHLGHVPGHVWGIIWGMCGTCLGQFEISVVLHASLMSFFFQTTAVQPLIMAL